MQQQLICCRFYEISLPVHPETNQDIRGRQGIMRSCALEERGRRGVGRLCSQYNKLLRIYCINFKIIEKTMKN